LTAHRLCAQRGVPTGATTDGDENESGSGPFGSEPRIPLTSDPCRSR